MNLGITGATGFVGKALIQAAIRQGYEVVAFSRDPSRTVAGCVEARRFSLDEPPDFSGCEAIIHLAGENVAGLWTAGKKRRIRDSRILGAQRVAEAIHIAKQPPEVLVTASAIGFYGDQGDAELDEHAPRGSGFLADICTENEAQFASIGPTSRVVFARLGIVLGDGGALRAMRPIFNIGLGGPLGHGQQWMSWIHLQDAASLLLFAVRNLDIRGPLNLTAPWPARNADFTKLLARSLHRPALLRVPAFAMRLVLREFADELLCSRRVLPAVATEHGFGFRFPELTEAVFANHA